MSFRHTTEMGEISGFGGDYEETCQEMLEAGVTWLKEQSEKPKLEGHSFKNVFGIIIADSDDAKALEKAMLDPVLQFGPSGAMHHAILSRLFWIAEHGWDAYCEEVIKQRKERKAK